MSMTDLLKEPFDPKVIHWRMGSTNQRYQANQTGNPRAKATSGMPLAYIDARDVMKRLDDVCGDDWQAKAPYKGYCEIGLKIDGEWLWRGNGAGETNVEGEKGQYSDAFKRAAVLWGVGRYLYYLPNKWVDMDEKGKFTPPDLPSWAKPSVFRFKAGEKDETYKRTMDYLLAGDEQGLKEVMEDYSEMEAQLAFWTLFSSRERSTINAFLNEEA